MIVVALAVRAAIFLVPAPGGLALVAGALCAHLAEIWLWSRHTRRFPRAVGAETLVGLPVEVVAPCEPYGTVKLRGERWNARCLGGAQVGDTLVVRAVEQLTLLVERA
jgi:membrane-bound serine protease (ClpP class)